MFIILAVPDGLVKAGGAAKSAVGVKSILPYWKGVEEGLDKRSNLHFQRNVFSSLMKQ